MRDSDASGTFGYDYPRHGARPAGPATVPVRPGRPVRALLSLSPFRAPAPRRPLAFILKDWHLTYGQSAVILLSSGLGAVPGAFFWGWTADRIGRRTVFIATALNVAFATGIMAARIGIDLDSACHFQGTGD